MSMPLNRNLFKIISALSAAILAFFAAIDGRSSAAHQDLPDGRGAELARAKCVTCHEADLILAQRLSRQGWVREVEKMIRWGATVSDSEKELLIDYFSAHFKPKTAASAVSSSAGSGPGRQVFENKCLVCHESDLTEQQRLSRPGWTREVEKMIRWGASVSDSEKEPLIDYLFETYGPRPLSGRK